MPRIRLIWLALLLIAGACGGPVAGTSDDDAFGDDLGFVSKFDGIATDAYVAPDAGKKDAVAPGDVASDLGDAGQDVADALDAVVDVDAVAPPDAVTSVEDAADAAPDDATLTDDVDDAGDAAAEDAADVTAVVEPAALCRPCAVDGDCQALDPASVCIGYGTTGAFCGSACALDADCPTGYACADAEGSSGPAATKQCLHKAGQCPCSAQAIADAAWTPCSISNALGTCPGKRTCTAGGLSACDAPAPAAESCNGKDDNCDGVTDGPGSAGCTTVYSDNDGDGVGAGAPLCLCSVGAGVAKANGDCDDSNAAIYPGAAETCDGLDNNCDGVTDGAGSVGCTTWYADSDQDGFGGGTGVCLCAADTAHPVSQGGDCNDNNKAIHPTAPELCNGIDDDCNGLTDDGSPVDCTTYFTDGDKDGFGAGAGVCLCKADAAHTVTKGGDCNDASAAVHPGVVETCNGIDDNCDGATDELGATGCSNFHVDKDGDGYGGLDVKCACAADPVYNTLDATDCDDGQPTVHPGAKEICDGLDNNCDGITDPPNLDTCTNYFYDGDADGYGVVSAQIKCQCAPSGLWTATVPNDCNDADKTIHPGATEICNSKDDNCDGQTDNGAGIFYYADGDGDTYGNLAVSLQSCTPVPTFVTNHLDCDDGKASVHPGAIEICDGIDNDCNGLTDDGLCDDANLCTTDTCKPGSGCTNTPTAGTCDDGNACTTGDNCATGTCKGAAINCDDANACTVDACTAGGGCTHTNSSGACSDGNACTTGDTCATGTCKGTTTNCDDANACTNDACAPATGCSHTANTAACSDNNACTTSDVCANSACAGTTLSCDDGDPCTTDACVPASGCTHTQTCSNLPFADAGNTYAEGLNAAGKLLAWGNAAAPPTGTYTQVSAGYYFACVVDAAGTMKCWGANTPTGLKTGTISGVKQVSVGNPHACVVKTDGTLQCWSTSSTQTTGVPTGTFTQVACGYDHSCALRADGTVACWGANSYGQTTVPTGETFSQITAGNYFSCGIRKSGVGIKCWGSDAGYAVSSAPATGSFIALSAGNMACAIQSNNTMVCWTTTGYGSSTPPAGTKWLSLGAGQDNVCGVLTSKSVQCFGDDANNVVTSVPLSGW